MMWEYLRQLFWLIKIKQIMACICHPLAIWGESLMDGMEWHLVLSPCGLCREHTEERWKAACDELPWNLYVNSGCTAAVMTKFTESSPPEYVHDLIVWMTCLTDSNEQNLIHFPQSLLKMHSYQKPNKCDDRHRKGGGKRVHKKSSWGHNYL